MYYHGMNMWWFCGSPGQFAVHHEAVAVSPVAQRLKSSASKAARSWSNLKRKHTTTVSDFGLTMLNLYKMYETHEEKW